MGYKEIKVIPNWMWYGVMSVIIIISILYLQFVWVNKIFVYRPHIYLTIKVRALDTQCIVYTLAAKFSNLFVFLNDSLAAASVNNIHYQHIATAIIPPTSINLFLLLLLSFDRCSVNNNNNNNCVSDRNNGLHSHGLPVFDFFSYCLLKSCQYVSDAWYERSRKSSTPDILYTLVLAQCLVHSVSFFCSKNKLSKRHTEALVTLPPQTPRSNVQHFSFCLWVEVTAQPCYSNIVINVYQHDFLFLDLYNPG